MQRYELFLICKNEDNCKENVVFSIQAYLVPAGIRQ